MKRYIALFLIPVIALSLASCKIKNKDGSSDGTSETASVSSSASITKKENGSDASVTAKDYSKVLDDLTPVKEGLVDKLGKTEKGKKIVAFFGDENETEFIVVEFKDGKVSKADDYRFYKEDRKYEAYAILAEKAENGFKAYKEEKCIQQNVTKQYRSKTYEEVYDKLKAHYNFK